MKQPHESIPASEEFLRRVIASSPDCIKILDLGGNLLAMTESSQRLLEIQDLTPHLHTCWIDWWKGHAREEAILAVAEATHGGTGHFEAFAETFGGTPKWWDVTISPIMGADGQPEKLLSVSRDITRRKVAEQELAETRARNSATADAERSRLIEVFQRSPSFITILRGPEHIYELANAGYCRLVGRPAEAILQKPIREVLPELAGQGFFELLDRVYATGKPFVGNDVSVLLRSEPGQAPVEHFVDFIFQPTHAADGTIDGLFVHGVDWTQRKLAERELLQVAEQRRLALDSAQMGWWHVDLLEDRVYIDERFGAIFGVSGRELPRTEVEAVIHPEDLEKVTAAAAAAVHPDHPAPFSMEYRVVHAGGAMRWVQAKGKAHFEGEAAAHRAVSLVGTAMDITEARAAQDALRESEARFRQLADAMPQIVFAGGPDGHLDYYNQQWYDYTGLPHGSTGNEVWDTLLHPDDFQGTVDTYTAALRSGGLYEKEFRVKRAADGEYRWFLGRARPIKDAAGNILRWFGTDTDIHDYKQLQAQNEQLLASERAARSEAERTSRMKDEFLATLSHKLRTPLNAVLGWTQVLRGDPANSPDVEAGLATIERNARAQNEIIEDLLDMSRIISGKVRLDVQRVDLAPIVEAAIETVRPAAEAKGIRLLPAIDPAARPVSGDPNRLQQVFWNLLSNAIKFTPKGGRVQVILERINSHLEVSVIDSGEGIASEFLPHVFDRFRQADASTTRQHGGLGLGLAIVKQLVELHGGSVQVNSPGPGRGTTFSVALPLTVLHPEADPKEIERRHPRGDSNGSFLPLEQFKLDGVKVLVVDDEADARALVKRLLEDRRAIVKTAGSTQEALDLIRAEPPDVLVSDIGMPGEDGYALIRQVRALPAERGGSVPAIALTAYARSEDRMKAIMAGFQMHLVKPVEAVELLVLVANLAGRTGVPVT